MSTRTSVSQEEATWRFNGGTATWNGLMHKVTCEATEDHDDTI